jgi:membrane-bound lytic murein transglycosylase D
MIKQLTFLLLLLTVSCSTFQNGREVITLNPLEAFDDDDFDGEKVAKHVEANTCEGCMIGSSSHENLGDADKKVYFLYGAEHLNLQNYYFDIPVVYNKAVKKWINYFTGRGRHHFERYSARAGRYVPAMSKILKEKNMPQDLIYLSMAESGFQTNAKSWARAVGPWQFMPYTGKKFGLKLDWYVDQRRDPFRATEAAAQYLSDLYAMFGSWELAAAGYNAGEGKIGRAIRRYRTKNFWKIRKGRYLKAETKNYVPKIMALAIIGKNLKAFGFEDIDYHAPLDFDEVEVSANTDLYYVAETLNVDFDELKKLNPELRRWQTPPDVASYPLRVPKGFKNNWKQCCSADQFTANNYQVYNLRGRSRLKDVARKFKVPVNLLHDLNPALSRNGKLAKKTAVVLPFRNGQSKRHNMYADLYELPPRRLRKKRARRRQIARAIRRGKKISNPREYYVVQRGDSLWSVSRKTGVSLDTLIKTNLRLVKRRQIKPGDKLAIR